MPGNVCCLLLSRSSTVFSNVLIHVGLIDPSYKGKIGILMYSLNEGSILFEARRRVAQLLFLKFDTVVFTTKPFVQIDANVDDKHDEDDDDDDDDGNSAAKKKCPNIRGIGKYGSSGK